MAKEILLSSIQVITYESEQSRIPVQYRTDYRIAFVDSVGCECCSGSTTASCTGALIRRRNIAGTAAYGSAGSRTTTYAGSDSCAYPGTDRSTNTGTDVPAYISADLFTDTGSNIVADTGTDYRADIFPDLGSHSGPNDPADTGTDDNTHRPAHRYARRFTLQRI